MESKVKCPICDCDSTDALIIDLRSCNSCNHIFKTVPKKNTHTKESLHLYEDPVSQIRELTAEMTETDTIEFIMPSMAFYSLEIRPSLFYRSEYNHYFNQMSLMVLLQRCNLIPLVQMNKWGGNICETKIKCLKIQR